MGATTAGTTDEHALPTSFLPAIGFAITGDDYKVSQLLTFFSEGRREENLGEETNFGCRPACFLGRNKAARSAVWLRCKARRGARFRV